MSAFDPKRTFATVAFWLGDMGVLSLKLVPRVCLLFGVFHRPDAGTL